MKYTVGYKLYGLVEVEAKDKEDAAEKFGEIDMRALKKLTNDYPEIGDIDEQG